MLFSSITFLFVFLPIVITLYYLVPKPLKNALLLIASLFFYAWGEPVYLVLMVLSILFNYLAGLDIDRKRTRPQGAKYRLIFAVVVNLFILGFFKYYPFLIQTLNDVFGADITIRELPLPIGISFYTFQALSYVIDIYRGRVEKQRNLLDFAMYIALFPQLIAGPIVRYVEIKSQLRNRKFSAQTFGKGVMSFLLGLAKKVIIADLMGDLFQSIIDTAPGSYSVLTAWLGVFAFAFQIYFDFSGYTDMAIGLGRMFGFELPINFRHPYLATSIKDFWSRWHITLSTWFREYVYIPLGGNRVSTQKNIRNLLIVWGLTGLWHGAAWTFLVWGLYYGILLILEKYVWGETIARWPHFFQRLYSLILIFIGWVFFFSPNMSFALNYLLAMFGIDAVAFIDNSALFMLRNHWLLFILAILGSSTLGYRIIKNIIGAFQNRIIKQMVGVSLYLGIFLVTLAFLVTRTYSPFIYFRF